MLLFQGYFMMPPLFHPCHSDKIPTLQQHSICSMTNENFISVLPFFADNSFYLEEQKNKRKGKKLTMQKKACVDNTAFIQSVIWQGCMRHCTLTGHTTNVNATNQVKLISRWINMYYNYLYNNQINAHVLIGQSAVGYCEEKKKKKSCVFWIII